jgi:signal peptidase
VTFQKDAAPVTPGVPETTLTPEKLALLRQALQVCPMMLDLTGLSMYPAIRPGDRSQVASVDPNDIERGDIILTTRDNRIYAHRVIGIKGNPPSEWLVKGDTLLSPDPPVRAEDILGRVIAVQRRGRLISLLTPRARAHGRLLAALSYPYSRAFMRVALWRRSVIARLANSSGIRARRRSRTEPTFTRPARESDIESIAFLMGDHQLQTAPISAVDMETLRGHAAEMLDSARAVGATLWVAERRGFVLGYAVVGPLDENGPYAPGWWVMSVYVKMTARGSGVAEAIVRAGLHDAASKHVPCVRYAAYETNRASIRLAEKLGFVPDASPEAQAFARHYEQPGGRGARLVILRKNLNP